MFWKVLETVLSHLKYFFQHACVIEQWISSSIHKSDKRSRSASLPLRTFNVQKVDLCVCFLVLLYRLASRSVTKANRFPILLESSSLENWQISLRYFPVIAIGHIQSHDGFRIRPITCERKYLMDYIILENSPKNNRESTRKFCFFLNLLRKRTFKFTGILNNYNWVTNRLIYHTIRSGYNKFWPGIISDIRQYQNVLERIVLCIIFYE